MYYCFINQGRTEVVRRDEDEDASFEGAEYAFELSSAGSEAEAFAIARKIQGLFKKTEPRERNVARIERYLGLLDMLDVVFTHNWNNNFEPIREFCRSYRRDDGKDADDVLEDIAGWGGIPCGLERFFISHVANMIATSAIYEEEDLKRFFPDGDDSVFAIETRRCFERLEDARN